MQSISKAIYLIDDNEHPYYGYEFDDRGLVQAERGYYPSFTFTKVYAEYESLLKRKFRKVQEGSLTLETNFVIDCDNGFSVKLYNEDKSACIGVITENADFTVWGEAATPVPVIKNEKNSFKLTVDFEKRVYDVILNNRFCARFVLPDEIDNLNHIRLGIEKGYTGKVDAKGVKLYAGYLVNEKFLAPFEGSVPSDLDFSGGTARVVREDNCTFSLEDIYHLAMDAEKEDCVLSKRIGIDCARLCYEIRFIDRTGRADAFFGLDECGFACRIGTVSYRDRVVCDYPVNIWNTLRFELFDGKLALRLNGRDICELDCEKQVFERYVVKVAKGTRLEVDDLSLFPLAQLPADYVEKPKPAKTKGYHVGVNVCSLWRNGFWRGRHDASWDVCTPFDELTPYLGYYDEGIPEVADWETKWFCEHGIDFQLQCWYGPRTIDCPIKFPGFSHALHDGYFNSVYKNNSKFAIMWENDFTDTLTSDSFRKYLVPYFIEYYFKNPNYYTIDNKPVFSIYNVGKLFQVYFGSTENARAEMDYLKAETVKAGFDGLILLCAGVGAWKEGVEMRDEMGFDGTYPYSHGSQAYLAENQINDMEAHREVFARYSKNVTYIPVASVGFNGVARSDRRAPIIEISEYQKVLRYIKEDFLPHGKNKTHGAWQDKLLLLDCWNEYDEGHWIAPTNLRGFGFLDAVREAFCEQEPHEDAMPTKNQKKRVCILTPEGHAWLRPQRNLKTDEKPGKVLENVYAFDFSQKRELDRWEYRFAATGKTYRNGAMCGKSDGFNPFIYQTDKIAVPAADVNMIKVTLKTFSVKGTPSRASFAMYFTTDTVPDIVAGMSIGMCYSEPSGTEGYTDCYINPRKNARWRGTVTGFRLDPPVGMWEIKKIELLKCEEPKRGNQVLVNGKKIAFDLPVRIENAEAYIPIYASNSFRMHMNAIFQWRKAQSELSFIIGEKTLIFRKDSDVCMCGTDAVRLPEKLSFVDGVPAIPIKTVCDYLGYACAVEKDCVNIRI